MVRGDGCDCVKSLRTSSCIALEEVLQHTFTRQNADTTEANTILEKAYSEREKHLKLIVK